MKCSISLLPLSAVLCLAVSGCGQSSKVNAEISKLNEAFPTANAAAPTTPDNSGGAISVSAVDPNTLVNRAVTALRNNDQEGAVMMLNSAKQQTGLTVQQRMAVQDTIAMVCGDLATRAGRGDAKAKAAISNMEKSYSQ